MVLALARRGDERTSIRFEVRDFVNEDFRGDREFCNAADFGRFEKDELRRLLRVVAAVGQSCKLGKFVGASKEVEVMEHDGLSCASSPISLSLHLCSSCFIAANNADSLMPLLIPQGPSPVSTVPDCTFVIEVPPKIWRPKPIDMSIPMDYSNDINESVFEFEQFGNYA